MIVNCVFVFQIEQCLNCLCFCTICFFLFTDMYQFHLFYISISIVAVLFSSKILIVSVSFFSYPFQCRHRGPATDQQKRKQFKSNYDNRNRSHSGNVSKIFTWMWIINSYLLRSQFLYTYSNIHHWLCAFAFILLASRSFFFCFVVDIYIVFVAVVVMNDATG